MAHHFISYSPVDGLDFVIRLRDALEAEVPAIDIWFDKVDLRPGRGWDNELDKAIRGCDSLLFVMSADSVEEQSVCRDEWMRALRYKKPIVPLLVTAGAVAPFRLEGRQHVDFTGDFQVALARLRRHLRWLASPEGVLQALDDRLADARRDLRRADDGAGRARIERDVAELERELADQRGVLADPEAAERQVQQRIDRGLERERQPAASTGRNRSSFVYSPQGVVPWYFQDRRAETELLGRYLADDAVRLVTVVGRGGSGKTAMVCRLLKALESGRLPDDGPPLAVDGIVYLLGTGALELSMPNPGAMLLTKLFAGLVELLPAASAARLDALTQNPQVSVEEKLRALLAEFPGGRTILLLDNFEDAIDPETLGIRAEELRDALRTVLTHPGHGLAVVLTTRVAPRDLGLVEPQRQCRLDLDAGLPSPYAENILRDMDTDGKVGLRDADEEVLAEARRRTRGNPRALEALFAILSVDRDTSLPELLTDTVKLLPEHVVEVLVGEAFSRLDPAAQRIMQALAVYGRPVAPAAVDYLLQPHLPGVDSAKVLGRLVNMQFARKESGRYYLHPVDRAFALGRVPGGAEADRRQAEAPPFTQVALRHRGAEWFRQARVPREDWRRLEDLSAHLAEIDLRCEGGELDTAATVLLEVDREYLMTWGHVRLVVDLHLRLQGRLDDPVLARQSMLSLSEAHYRLGEYGPAVERARQSLDAAREHGDRVLEGWALNALGNCYAELLEVHRAVDHYRQALAIARSIGSPGMESVCFGNLANRDTELGQFDAAMRAYQRQLELVRANQLRPDEAVCLSNLGLAWGQLGDPGRGLALVDEALTVARDIGFRLAEGASLGVGAELLVDQGRLEAAIHRAREATAILEQIGDPYQGTGASQALAAAHLRAGSLAEARAAAEQACRWAAPASQYHARALLGVIAMRQGDRDAAAEAFKAAVASADAIPDLAVLFEGLDAKGLALAGLALVEGEHHLDAAAAAYRAARAITSAAGVVARVTYLLDALAEEDPGGVLARVRAAASGREEAGVRP